MNNIYRVVEIDDKQVERSVFEGTIDQCDDWIEENEFFYPEFQYRVERVQITYH